MAWYFREVQYSSAVERKINALHKTSIDDVADALEGLDQALCVEDHERGLRLFVRGHTPSGRRLNVFLYPVDVADGVWRLATAYPD